MSLSPATSSHADEATVVLPSPEQIRANYRDIASQGPAIPRPVLLAFVAAEDPDFFHNPLQNSTVTHQIAKWHLLSSAEVFRETALTFIVSDALSRDEALNWYVNRIYLGRTCFGVSDAAMAYFGKSVEELNLEEAAHLAGLA